ncbi:N-acetylmuramoyl-L-alanine amidase [Gastrophryne carolinensis]
MGWHEQGVVLAPDGSSVALRSLLDSLVWGWRTQCNEQNIESSEKTGTQTSQTLGTNNIYPKTISSLLGSAYANHKASQTLYFPNGCWDSISSPSSFQLQDVPTINDLTLAIVNGALDGSLLREMLKNKTQKMSDLLQSYYGSKPPKSPYRRQNFQALFERNQLEKEIEKQIACCRKDISGSSLPYITDDELKIISNMAANQFEQNYLECPAVIPRCMWEAKPYKGTPTLLHPPLQNIYIHHTSTPSSPCLSFGDCAADMRSMQNFHQQDRAWDDIGYSFVAGSDGYLYEGRGWLWVGAHTKGHNSDGYGVSFIGDFTALIPEGHILSLVKDRFLKCGVRSGYIASNFSIRGHRQVVNTSCPGDALFQEISTWKNFKATETL